MCFKGKKLKNFSESWKRVPELRPREIKTNMPTVERGVVAEAGAVHAVAAEVEEGAGHVVEHAAGVVEKAGLAADRAVVAAVVRGPKVARGVGVVVIVMGGAQHAQRVNQA